jgi:hypothetical protein
VAELKYDFKFDDSGNQMPLVLIGKNGSVKTVFLSHIVNAIISAKQLIYDNSEVEQGKVYKLRSSGYIRRGALFSRSVVDFTQINAFVEDWQLSDAKENLVNKHELNPAYPEWAKIPDPESNHFASTFTPQAATQLIDNGCIQYFPSNRFEEPAWLNTDNLTSQVDYSDFKRVQKYSNRSIISLSTLKESQNWLLDVLLDRSTLEMQSGSLPVQVPSANEGGQPNRLNLQLLLGYSGQASLIYDELLKLLNQLFGFPNGILRFGLGHRLSRQLSIMRGQEQWIPNLFQLSSGETLLLDLFLCILKDYDLSYADFTKLDDVNGIVLIDEIDLHLHGNLQKDILPKMIKLFPKIQFIITTHSPMFLLGMQNEFGTDGFDIIEMPSGEAISVENFAEFQDLFDAIRETKTFAKSIETKIKESRLPTVFVEGDYDVRYLSKTIELFCTDEDLLNQIRLLDSDGYGNLDKIWKSMDSKVIDTLTADTLLLYDCDVEKQDSSKGKVTRKVMPSVNLNPIKRGVENLLSEATIQKLQTANSKFIDVTFETAKTVRGESKVIPESKEINKDEKRNICEWLCQNGDTSDFEGFKVIVDIIRDFISQNDNCSV